MEAVEHTPFPSRSAPDRRAARARAIAAALLMGLVLAGCGRKAEKTRVAGPNLVLLTVDTLRADRLGCYGYSRDTSPVLDRLAREGTLFEEAYAQRGSTWPSLASIMTSQHPVTHGVRENGMQLSNAPDALAEVLTARGYHCGAVVANSAQQNWEGFDSVQDVQAVPQDRHVADAAVRWLQANTERPFFLWVHYVATHDPYEPPAEFDRFTEDGYTGRVDGGLVSTTQVILDHVVPTKEELEHLDALYDGEVAFSDAMLEPVLDALEQGGVAEETLVAFASDHGDEMYDHHHYLFHHASVYEGVLRIPLVLWQPGAIPAGRRVDDLVQSIDIAPTLLELLELSVPASYQGRSLLPCLKGEELPAQPAFAEIKDQMLVVRDTRSKYVFNPLGISPPRVPNSALDVAGIPHLASRNVVPIGLEELYDVRKDRYETRDLTSERPAELARMRELADGFRAQFGWKAGSEVDRRVIQEVPEELRQRLEELGYVLGPSTPGGGAGSGADTRFR